MNNSILTALYFIHVPPFHLQTTTTSKALASISTTTTNNTHTTTTTVPTQQQYNDGWPPDEGCPWSFSIFQINNNNSSNKSSKRTTKVYLTKGVPDLFFKSTTTTATRNHQKELQKLTWRRVSLIFFNFSRRSSSVSGSPSSWHKYQITIWIYISKLKYPNIFLQPQISMANIILLKNYSPGAGPFDHPRQTSRSDSPCWSNNYRRKYVSNKDWGAMSCFFLNLSIFDLIFTSWTLFFLVSFPFFA